MKTYHFKSDGGVPSGGVRFLSHPDEDEVTRWLPLPHGRIVKVTIEVDQADHDWLYTVSLVRRRGVGVLSWELPAGHSFSEASVDNVETGPEGDLVQMKIQRGDFGAIDSTGTRDLGALSPTGSPFESITVDLELELVVPVGWDDDPLSMGRRSSL